MTQHLLDKLPVFKNNVVAVVKIVNVSGGPTIKWPILMALSGRVNDRVMPPARCPPTLTALI
jgi:hypothetical protein